MNKLLLTLALLAGVISSNAADKNGFGEILSVKKIWDAGKHNAFTDLIRFKGKWYCTFREADDHVGGDGKLRVLESKDGETWTSAALLAEEGIDLRDPKLCITPDNWLMITAGGSVYRGTKTLQGRQPRVAFSRDGHIWTPTQRVLGEGDWLWRVTWHKGRAYGVSYDTTPLPAGAKDSAGRGEEWKLKFVESLDGVNYHLVTTLAVPDRPNETTLRFLKNGDCVALVRREGTKEHPDKHAWIGVAQAPYKEWSWKPAGVQIGGPNFIPLPDGRMVAAGRQYNPSPVGAKTFLGAMDLASVKPQLIFPSAGDNSYPGLVWEKKILWMSYYASHEGKTSIYLAKVKLN
ncbi:MAG: exo-alpha-sialidase [Verrucomicrobiota bacterium]